MADGYQPRRGDAKRKRIRCACGLTEVVERERTGTAHCRRCGATYRLRGAQVPLEEL